MSRRRKVDTCADVPTFRNSDPSDPEVAARQSAYGKRPKPFPLRSFYVLLGYDVPQFLSETQPCISDGGQRA